MNTSTASTTGKHQRRGTNNDREIPTEKHQRRRSTNGLESFVHQGGIPQIFKLPPDTTWSGGELTPDTAGFSAPRGLPLDDSMERQPGADLRGRQFPRSSHWPARSIGTPAHVNSKFSLFRQPGREMRGAWAVTVAYVGTLWWLRRGPLDTRC
ncbi:uncharacterized protein EDB91DRAFT_1082196 [Suillus paluster]|uniref:uncharacterized protein n=1 Tax=Suillus paluster TaxID=48578 RepID=UPI001B867F3A|nr:uncharacterized protein EDB91DRAFT_1082196 [Suillus paluster]KAG1740241.1 hypothetical protein EDB91DRAFT_1082196 [Suillus paluster]